MLRAGGRIRQIQGGGREVIDLSKEEPDQNTQNHGIDPSVPAITMPPYTRGATAAAAAGNAPVSPPATRKRTAPASSSSTRPAKARKGSTSYDDLINPFDDDELNDLFGDDGKEEHIDLSKATEVPDQFKVPKKDNRIKLGKFQCVVCMDDVTGLTVTHCGHLFCSQCLHDSLNVDSSRRKCPVCRQHIDDPSKTKKIMRTFHHLELKLMTTTKKGKQKADS